MDPYIDFIRAEVQRRATLYSKSVPLQSSMTEAQVEDLVRYLEMAWLDGATWAFNTTSNALEADS